MPSVRVQAVGVIGFLKLEEAVPALTAATTDRRCPCAPRRGERARVLAHEDRGRNPSLRALADADWMVREIAAETLGPQGRRSVGADAADRGALR